MYAYLSVNGNWTEWSAWSPCSIPCIESGDNTTVGVKTRNRTCSVPTPEYGGFMCIGQTEENATCPDTICPGNAYEKTCPLGFPTGQVHM